MTFISIQSSQADPQFHASTNAIACADVWSAMNVNILRAATVSASNMNAEERLLTNLEQDRKMWQLTFPILLDGG